MNTESILAGAFLLGALVATARADTLRVPQDFATIQEAVDAALPFDVVLVSKGTHAPFTVAGKSDITIRGKGKAIVDGGAALAPVVSIDGSTAVTLIKLVVINSGADGIEVTDSTGITISKCKVEDVAGIGIQLGGSGHRVEKCRLFDTDDLAIETDEGSMQIVIEKNRMTSTDGALTFRGSDHVALKNRVKDSHDEGFSLIGVNCLAEKNRFLDVEDDGIDVEGDDNVILKNRIKDARGNGVEVNPASGDPFVVTGNLFEKNRVVNSGGNGFFVETPGNTFRENRAKKSDLFDLLDEAGPGANVYEDNKFGTEQIAD